MLERTLTVTGFEVEVVADGPSALVSLERVVPDVVVLDVKMPDMDGVAVCRRLRAKGLEVPVLMLTARDAVADRVEGLQAGADDYLVKPFATEELTARLRALTRRTAKAPAMLTFGDLALDLSTRTASRAGVAVELTGREVELLELLMREPRQVVSRERALAEVWRDEAAANVVDRYVTRLRAKLGEPSLIRTVRGVGFMLTR
ncbi:MAG: response regulator transcription factor [Actinomycetota bacterium]|nr:response regulator transcription factor [Actinomycetota bacterium]MDQ3720821.1 response regulator transcription factor [Actinomycetota bacterium]